MIEAQQSFDRNMTADLHALADLRRQFARWLAGLGIPDQVADDVVLAVYEALANAVEHAYQGNSQGGRLELHASRNHDRLTVSVIDYGRWKIPDAADSYRGRGIVLISMLADSNTVQHRPDGTTVTMDWNQLSAPRDALA